MADAHSTILRNRRELANGLFTFTLAPPDAIRDTFHTPGQYHRLAVNGAGDSYFALASAPATTPFEYLARSGSPLADALVDGATVHVSAVLGPGFPLVRARGHDVLLVATGTGIAPIRSVIRTLLPLRTTFGQVHLVYGVRSDSEFAYASEFSAWAAAGIELHLTLSRRHGGWHGEVGRVQQRLGALTLNDAYAFLCGQPIMEREVTHQLARQGLESARIFVNHEPP